MIGDALVDLFLRASSSPPSFRGLDDWLREVSRPPAGLGVHSDAGAYTGVLLVKDNDVIAALVFETAHRPSESQYRRSARSLFEAPYPYGSGDEDDEPR